MKKPIMPEDVIEYFRKTGSKGGKVRARRYSKRQLSEWGKQGGRPKDIGKKQSKKGGK